MVVLLSCGTVFAYRYSCKIELMLDEVNSIQYSHSMILEGVFPSRGTLGEQMVRGALYVCTYVPQEIAGITVRRS